MSDNSLLEKLKAEYEQKIAEMELRHKQEMDLMKEQLSSMRKLLFSSKSERTKIVLPNPDQLSLFDEVEQEAAPEPLEEAKLLRHISARSSAPRRSWIFPRQSATLLFWIFRKRIAIAQLAVAMSWFQLEKSMSAMKYALSRQRLLSMRYTRRSTSAKHVKMTSMWNL
nr:hypothetical protein [Anaerovibrio lipolyticus]